MSGLFIVKRTEVLTTEAGPANYRQQSPSLTTEISTETGATSLDRLGNKGRPKKRLRKAKPTENEDHAMGEAAEDPQNEQDRPGLQPPTAKAGGDSDCDMMEVDDEVSDAGTNDSLYKERTPTPVRESPN
jgi:hypothetical protein